MPKQFDPARFLHAARILVSCALAYMASKLVALREEYWAVITAVVVTQPVLGDTLSACRFRVLGTVIGAVAGLAVIATGELGASTFVLFWVALVPLSILTAYRPNLRLCCITLVIVVLVPATGSVFVRPFERVIEILVGCLASIVVTAATPSRPKTIL